MTRLYALAATTGCVFFAIHSLSAGIKGPDYVWFLFGLLWFALAGGFAHFGVRHSERETS